MKKSKVTGSVAGICCCEAGSSFVASVAASLAASFASLGASFASLVAKGGGSSHSIEAGATWGYLV